MAGRSERTLREIIRVVAGRFVGMLAVLVIVVAAVGVASWYAPRWYRSEVQLLAKPTQLSSPLETPVLVRDKVSLYISTLRSIITSDHVLASTRLRLDGQAAPSMGGDSAKAENWNRKVKAYIAENSRKINELRDRISVVTPGGPDATFTQTLTVRVLWPEEGELARELGEDPRQLAVRRARDLAGHVVEAYKYRSAELERRRIREAADFLAKKSLTAAKAELDEAAAEYDAFIKTEAGPDLLDIKHMTDAGGGHETGKARLATGYAGELTGIQGQIAVLDALQEAMKAELADKKKSPEAIKAQEKPEEATEFAVPDEIATGNPSVRSLESKILLLKMKINSLVPRYTSSYRELKNSRAELVAARLEMRRELSRHLVRLRQTEATLAGRRAVITSNMEADRKRIEDLAVKVSQWQRLQAFLDAAQKRYDAEKDKVIAATTAKELANTPILVSVLSEPSMPDPERPRKPIFWLNMVLAIVGGVILSLIYAFSADHFDHSLKSIDDAERYLGVPVLASVPKLGRKVIRTTGGG